MSDSASARDRSDTDLAPLPNPPASLDLARFLGLLQRYDLVAEEALTKCLRAVPHHSTTSVASELVARTLLSRWQISRIYAGKGGFTLGRYQLVDQIAAGGMGLVLKAQTPEGATVAIKILSREHVENKQAVSRFHREINAALSLDHTNIVRALDSGIRHGMPYLVMEFVPGRTLRSLVQERGPLPIPFACDLLRQGALGLAHAHERGIVHRDFKPSNVIVTRREGDRRPIAKVTDFGLARLHRSNAEATDLTGENQVMGTVDFISPEQARSARRANERSDLYSLGCTLFYALTGEYTHSGETAVEKLSARLSSDPPPIRKLRETVPRDLETLLIRLLHRNPDRRPKSAAWLAEHLGPYARGDYPKEEDLPPLEPLPFAEMIEESELRLDLFLENVDSSSALDIKPSGFRSRSTSRWMPYLITLGTGLVMLGTTWMVVNFGGPPENPLGVVEQPGDRAEPWGVGVPGTIVAWQASNGFEAGWSPRGEVIANAEKPLVIEGGSVEIAALGDIASRACADTSEVSLELVFTATEAESPQMMAMFSISSGPKNRNFLLAQEGSELVVGIRTPATNRRATDPVVPIMRVRPGKQYHLIVSYRDGETTAYLDGRAVSQSDHIRGELRNWEPLPLRIGSEQNGQPGWKGTIERFRLTNLAVSPDDAFDRYRRFRGE